MELTVRSDKSRDLDLSFPYIQVFSVTNVEISLGYRCLNGKVQFARYSTDINNIFFKSRRCFFLLFIFNDNQRRKHESKYLYFFIDIKSSVYFLYW